LISGMGKVRRRCRGWSGRMWLRMLLSNVQAVVTEHPQPYKKMGEHGYVCPWVEKEYGGPGMGFEYSVIIIEEMAYAGVYGLMAGLHSDIVAPYIHSFGNKEQKKK